MAKKVVSKSMKLKVFLEEEGFCNKLGYNHQPYGWLESTCDEMVEEKIGSINVFFFFCFCFIFILLDDIIGVIKFHDRIMRTGLTPTETMPDMMCKEFFKCKPITASKASGKRSSSSSEL
jgi:hypothetical protein